MASISSLSGSSSSSSIYSNPNAVTGLASGLDTEAMVEKAVSGYESKIESLIQEQTKLEWEQEEYRSIIDLIAKFTGEYTDYMSDTNLSSSAFYANATNIETTGANAALVSATGSTESTISILGVEQLATAATYSVSGKSDDKRIIETALDLDGEVYRTGTITLQYTNDDDTTSTIKLSFNAEEMGEVGNDTAKLADLINKKLTEGGAPGTIQASQSGTGVSIEGDVTVSAASGDIAELLGKDEDGKYTAELNTVEGALTKTVSEAIEGGKLSFTYNGTTKSITLGSYGDAEAMKTDLQEKLDAAFGSGSVTVSTDDGKLSFSPGSGSTLSISGSALTTLGFSDKNQTSYMDTSDTLGALLGGDKESYTLTVNDKEFSFTADTKLSDVLSQINKSNAGVSVSYSSLSDKFLFTATETGSVGRIELGGDLAEGLFGIGTDENGNATAAGVLTKGEDAKFTVKINGTATTLTRSSNTVDLDGLKVTLKGTFEEVAESDAVKFNVKSDSEKIVSTIKDMVTAYNELVEKVKKAYATKPLTDSSGDKYKPLTESDRADMSETAIENYEKKAKTGLLFGDRDLSSFYYTLTGIISTNVNALHDIGITTNYSGGLTTLSVDETKLTKALESDVDKVKDAMTGFMTEVDSTMDRYGSVVGKKGILVSKAGSELAPTTLNENEIQNRLNDYQELIAKWREKLSAKIDYYSRQFSLLERMMSQMNSQSSTLYGMTGGY